MRGAEFRIEAGGGKLKIKLGGEKKKRKPGKRVGEGGGTAFFEIRKQFRGGNDT